MDDKELGALRRKILSLLAFTLLFLPSCSRHPRSPAYAEPDSLSVIRKNLEYRAAQDSFFRMDPLSPFNRDTSITFTGLKWFPIRPEYRKESTLHLYPDPDTVTVMGTRGETRRELRYGYFEFALAGDDGKPVLVRLHVYKFTPYDSVRYARYRENLNVWFTDRTSGNETYHVGRYVDVGDDLHDPQHLYVIDLNRAYNPYCAYSSLYSCAIPRKEDHLDISVRAGEMKYHE